MVSYGMSIGSVWKKIGHNVMRSHFIQLDWVQQDSLRLCFINLNSAGRLSSFSWESEASEWVIKFNGLSGDSEQRDPYSPYKPWIWGKILQFIELLNSPLDA